MNNLYEILEICLQEIEQGAQVDKVLLRYPDLADELRPILEASVDAKSMAVLAPSPEVIRRNRARVLQHAAQMREAGARRSSQRTWLVSLRRVAVTLAVVAILFISGTNLVRAASTTLPGDNLYPVKRTWEDVLLLFTFDIQQREALEREHENERLHELRELFAEGRAEEVEFAGVVTSQNGNEWVISEVAVRISPETEVRDPIVVGSPVRVKGQTQGDGVVLAERIRLLPPGAELPDVEIEDDGNGDDQEKQENDNSGKGSNDNSNEDGQTNDSGSESESKDELLNDNDQDNNQNDNSGSGSVDGSSQEDSSNDGDNSNVDDNSNNDNNDGGGSNGSNDNTDDSGGGGDNSGSGGGGGGGGDD